MTAPTPASPETSPAELIARFRRWLAWGVALAALLYVALAGFGIPAQGTLLMLAVVGISLWTARLLAVSQILAAALLVVLLCDP